MRARAIGEKLKMKKRPGYLEQKTIKQIEDMTTYLSADGLSGYGITKDGDLVSVFNNSHKKGLLKDIMPHCYT